MAPSPRLLLAAVSWIVLGACGCSEELGPERFATAKVRGMVTVGKSPVSGGWIAFDPVEGTRGNLRIARIRPDGSFEADRVPVGRVSDRPRPDPRRSDRDPGGSGRLARVPDGPLADPPDDPSGPRCRLADRPARRGIPARPAAQGKPAATESIAIEVRRPSTIGRSRPTDRPTLAGADPSLGSGSSIARARAPIHLDWPVDQIEQAIGDAEGTVWVDIEDLESACNASVETMLRDVFHFHALAIEDALQDTHVPKVDDWGKYLYIVVDTIDFRPRDRRPPAPRARPVPRPELPGDLPQRADRGPGAASSEPGTRAGEPAQARPAASALPPARRGGRRVPAGDRAPRRRDRRRPGRGLRRPEPPNAPEDLPRQAARPCACTGS